MATRRARIRVAPNVSARINDSHANSKVTQNEKTEEKNESAKQSEEIHQEPREIEIPGPKENDVNVTETELIVSNSSPAVVEDKQNHEVVIPEPPAAGVTIVTPENVEKSSSPLKSRSRFTKVRPNLDASRKFPSKTSSPDEPAKKIPVQRLVNSADFPPDPDVNISESVERENSQTLQDVEQTQVETVLVVSAEDVPSKKLPPKSGSTSSTKQVVPRKTNSSANNKKSAPRRHFNSVKQKPPEKSRMRMFDLIYWNPTTNPVQIRQTEIENRLNEEQIIGSLEEEKDDEIEPSEDSNSTDAMPVPQVKLAADGSIIVDERSLVIETTASKKSVEKSPIVYENSSVATYSSFRKVKNGRYWDAEETKKFYKVLNTVGTDFSMMSQFFPKRTRHELKLKFNREDRINKCLIDKAISEPQQFDFCVLEELIAEDENDVTRKKSKKTASRSKRRSNNVKTSRRTKRRKTNCISDDEDEEISDSESVEVSPDAELIASTLNDDKSDNENKDISDSDDEDDDDDSNATWTSLSRPTRSGRQPKRPSTFSASTEPKQRNNSNKVMPASTTPLEDVLRQAVTSPVARSDGSLVFVPGPKDPNTQVIHIYRISPLSQTFSVIPGGTDKPGNNLVIPFSSPMNPGQQIIINPTQNTTCNPD